MLKLAKVLVLLVRALALVSIVLGVLVWSGKAINMVGAHIGIGFLVALAMLVLGVVALLRRAITPGILAVVFAFLLPYVGFLQFRWPLVLDARFAVPQVLHFVIAILSLGIAEMANGAVQRSSR